MKQFVLISLFVFFTGSLVAKTPKTVVQQEQSWLGYLNQTRLSNRWGFWADVHYRRTDFLARPNQQLFRAGLTYYLADNIRLTAVMHSSRLTFAPATSGDRNTGRGSKSGGRAGVGGSI